MAFSEVACGTSSFFSFVLQPVAVRAMHAIAQISSMLRLPFMTIFFAGRNIL
jgi:hypothetical protein